MTLSYNRRTLQRYPNQYNRFMVWAVVLLKLLLSCVSLESDTLWNKKLLSRYFPSVTGNKASFAIYAWSVSSCVLYCDYVVIDKTI